MPATHTRVSDGYPCSYSCIRTQVSEPSQSADGGGYLSIARGASKPNWTGLFALLFKHSSCQQPLVASALARIAEDPEHREAIAQARCLYSSVFFFLAGDG